MKKYVVKKTVMSNYIAPIGANSPEEANELVECNDIDWVCYGEITNDVLPDETVEITQSTEECNVCSESYVSTRLDSITTNEVVVENACESCHKKWYDLYKYTESVEE